MANINRIDVELVTGTKPGADTSGSVYIGIAGREFHIDATGPDFGVDEDRIYILGKGANVLDAGLNDPRKPQLDTSDLSKFPAYLRFEPTGSGPDWNLEKVVVTVNPETDKIKFQHPRLFGSPDIWLGQKYGKFVYLTKT